MNSIIHNLNDIAQFVLLVVTIVLAVISSTKWGKSQASLQARTVLELTQDAAYTAVHAVEQMHKGESSATDSSLPERKLEEALAHGQSILKQYGVSVDLDQLRAQIEAAVHHMNGIRIPESLAALAQPVEPTEAKTP